MNNIHVLDCTLRDGGYVNQWQFGENNIKDIITGLIDAHIDIVECGFVTQKKERNQDSSLFDSMETVRNYLPDEREGCILACMINYGEFSIEDLPTYDGTSIDAIRVAFFKKDMDGALEFCRGIAEKGYKLFLQPMVTVSYTDEEFVDLIQSSNKIDPYAFYIVDSFGVLKRRELMRLYRLVDDNLKKSISIGYHSHNNNQMAFSNAQTLADIKTTREIIIDSSVFGMGRGAGNLNTELFIEHINEMDGNRYEIRPILKIYDKVLSPIYAKHFWGYSMPYYISSMNNCHPYYAMFLKEKDGLTLDDMNEILHTVEEYRKVYFKSDYLEDIYAAFMSKKPDR